MYRKGKYHIAPTINQEKSKQIRFMRENEQIWKKTLCNRKGKERKIQFQMKITKEKMITKVVIGVKVSVVIMNQF